MRLTKERRSALSIGISLVIMTFAAMIAMGAVFAPLFEISLSDYPSFLEGNSFLFLSGIMLWGVILLTDFIVSIGVYNYYKSQNVKRAIVTAGLRLLYTFILGYGIYQLIFGYIELTAISTDYGKVQDYVIEFQSIWQSGLIIFGLHLIVLAPLVCRKRSILLVISVFLLIAGIGYVLSNTLALFITDYETIRPNVELVFILPMILGEFGFAIWMIIKGGKKSVLDQPLSDAA